MDLSDRRLGHPLRVLRALVQANPKTHFPWPNKGNPYGAEKAGILLLLGFSPYPNTPPFMDLVHKMYEKVSLILIIYFNKYFSEIRVSSR